MNGSPDGPDLERLEADVIRALERGDEGPLRILGHGEITLVLGSPADAPRWACKRLPVFPDALAAERYRSCFDRYLALLAERGTQAVPSRFATIDGNATGVDTGTSGVVGYVVQPVLPAESLGPEVLRASAPDADHPVVVGMTRAAVAVCDPRTGLDGQLSNWAWDGTDLTYLDVTTPMLFHADGRSELDLSLFLAAYPAAMRPPIRRFVAPGVIGAYRDPRNVLVDLAANLVKERLEGWIPAVLTAAGRALPTGTEPINEDEARRYYRSDARLWELMLRLRRADRWWQRRVRRRVYPFLLPGAVRR